MYHNFLIHSSVIGHLGCIHVVANLHSAAVNNRIHVSFSSFFSSGCMPRSGIAGMVVLFLAFKGISISSSIVAVSVYIPTNSARALPFSTPSPAFIACRPLDDGHSDQCEVIPNGNLLRYSCLENFMDGGAW